MNLTKLITTAKIKIFIKLKFFVFRLYIYNTKYKYYFPGKIKQRYCKNITVNNRLLVVFCFHKFLLVLCFLMRAYSVNFTELIFIV